VTPGPRSDASLRQGLWDPFDALPIDRDGKTQFLMHHCMSSSFFSSYGYPLYHHVRMAR
jgi:hypothetical protein